MKVTPVMSGAPGRHATLICTLGVEPQVVTITLDCLLAEGAPVDEVVAVHTEDAGVREALAVLEEEFSGVIYPSVTLRAVPVTVPGGPVADFRGEDELRGLLRALYTEVRRAREQGRVVHLCVSGGRKVMGIMAVVVAQLLFGPEDRAWHLVTEGWRPGAERRLHLPPGEKVWLVPVPVLRWSEAATLMRTVAELDDPAAVVEWYEKLSREARERRKGEFIRRWLTPAEREVVRLACKGLDNAAIARALFKGEQTVANQLGAAYEKLREWLEYPEGNVDRSRLIAEFAPYFVFTEEEG
ncbi:CRISPR-associated ring nuclease [Candidatus Desulforudis audaxviator]|uniref:CRISPR-associated ring nuclease n=1 Tax=Candidatus Desulforudis audaxviator TaxID=471827 RepID=UPI00140FE8A3|nr:CRISPR-associated ring nuclease [Candidatus Desulforudis audaxviator]